MKYNAQISPTLVPHVHHIHCHIILATPWHVWLLYLQHVCYQMQEDVIFLCIMSCLVALYGAHKTLLILHGGCGWCDE